MSDDEAMPTRVDPELEIARLRMALAKSEAQVAWERAESQHRIRNLLNIVRAISSRSLERAVSLV